MNFSTVLKSGHKVTMKEAGMEYVSYLGYGEHLLYDTEIKQREIWFSNKNHASFGLIYKNTYLEFARTARYECITDGTPLEKSEAGYYCPKCSCHTIAPEEDGMYAI